MSFFTIKEIEMHWESSRKIPGLSIIVKTLDRGRKFKEERDVVETYNKQNMFFKRLQFFLFISFFVLKRCLQFIKKTFCMEYCCEIECWL